MTDEITTEAAEEAAETETEQTAPAITDEQMASALGVDADYFAEVKGQIKDLNGFYAKLNKRSMEIAEQRKQVEARPADADDDDIDLDEGSQRVLRKFLQRELAPLASAVQRTTVESMQEAALDFARTHADLAPTAVDAAMEEIDGWNATTPAQLKRNLERAYKLAKADTFDPDAIVESKLAERMAKLSDGGGEVVEVKPKRGAVTQTRSEAEVLADPHIPAHEKWAMLNKG